MKVDLYRILGVRPEADPREIRSAYRTLARKTHPDTGEGSSEERFRAIQEAYSVLSDPAKRTAYDRSRQPEITGSSPTSFRSTRAWQPPRYTAARHSHVDLRDIGRSRVGEPVGGAYRDTGRAARMDLQDEFGDLLRLVARMLKM